MKRYEIIAIVLRFRPTFLCALTCIPCQGHWYLVSEITNNEQRENKRGTEGTGFNILNGFNGFLTTNTHTNPISRLSPIVTHKRIERN